MRIAIVLDYSLDLIGGAQRAALNEAAAFVAGGHGVVLVAPRPADPRAVLPLGNARALTVAGDYLGAVLPVAAAQPTTGGNAPDAPPITMFCGVQRFSHIV